MENTSENDKTAAEWQGTDRYPGIDAYEKKTLPCGTKLYALVYRGVDNKFDTPAYFFDEKALEGIGDDSTKLNERLQVRPFCPPDENFGILFADVFRKTTQTFFLEIYCREYKLNN